MEKESALELPITLNELSRVLVFTALCVASFFIPFALGHPQALVGTLVNACLFLSALFLPTKFYLPLSILPSLGVLARGLVFGPLTVFLIYFLPFIWLGNLILILVFRNLFSRTGYIFSGLAASAVKYLVLTAVAGVYFKLSIVPAMFLTVMGINQLATALAGCLISFFIFKFYAGKFNSRG